MRDDPASRGRDIGIRTAPSELIVSTIAIVDDHELLAETLRVALKAQGIDAVRITPGDGTTVLASVLQAGGDLVLLDLDLGRFGDTTPMVAPLVAAGVRVLIVTGVVDRARIAAALEQGAIGYQSKGDGFDALLAKATSALTATGSLDPQDRLAMFEELRQARAEQDRRLAPFQKLTSREQDALRALAHGQTVSQIAHAWVVSESTMRSHVRGILNKLDVTSQLAAVAMAIDSGWLDLR
jgi:DNA-binding NarL/FixJ family response regulator